MMTMIMMITMMMTIKIIIMHDENIPLKLNPTLYVVTLGSENILFR